MFHLLILLTNVHFPKICQCQSLIPLNALLTLEKAFVLETCKVVANQGVWGKQSIIVSILCSWGVKWRRLPWGTFPVRGAWSELSVFRMCISGVVSLSLFLFGLASPLPLQGSVTPFLFTCTAELNLPLCWGWSLCCRVKLDTSVFHLVV